MELCGQVEWWDGMIWFGKVQEETRSKITACRIACDEDLVSISVSLAFKTYTMENLQKKDLVSQPPTDTSMQASLATAGVDKFFQVPMCN
jgi:hypothetical protein